MDSITERKIRADDPLEDKLVCRPLINADLLGIQDLMAAGFGERWTEKDLTFFLNHSSRFHWGIYRQVKRRSELVAYLLTLNVQGELDVLSIAVHPDYQRRGLGSRLLSHCQTFPEIKSIHLEVDERNKAAIGLYEGVGFNLVRRRASYYKNRFDALVFAWDSALRAPQLSPL